MDFSDFAAGQNDDGRRLDRVIRRLISADNLSNIYKSIRKGLIRVNGARAKPDQRIYEGDIISVASFITPETENSLNKNAGGQSSLHELPYEIIFHNEHILVLNKPYDIPVHGSSRSMDKDIACYYCSAGYAGKSLSFTPGPLHRLDRKTTGAIAFSWSLTGAQWFSENIARHNIRKAYLGIAEGHIAQKELWRDSVTHDNYEHDSNGFHTVSVSERDENAETVQKEAVTHAEPLAYGRYEGTGYTLVRYEIETGRTHQIRAQSYFHGFPLLGDTAYRGKRISEEQDFYLHALSLSFPENNPAGLPASVKASLPDAFTRFLKKTLTDKILLNEDMKFIIDDKL